MAFVINKDMKRKVIELKTIYGISSYIGLNNKQANMKIKNVYAPFENYEEEQEFYARPM